MNNKIIGLRLDNNGNSEQNSAIMKKLCSALFGSGKVTFSQFLFPYVDSIMLAENVQACFFGSHVLLWDIDRQLIEDCIEAVYGGEEFSTPEIAEIEFDAAEITAFFGEPCASEDKICIGGFASLLTGKIRPWSVREHSRGFCSFAEHIARMSGYSVQGLSADHIVIKSEHECDLAELERLFAAKTGGIMKIKRS